MTHDIFGETNLLWRLWFRQNRFFWEEYGLRCPVVFVMRDSIVHWAKIYHFNFVPPVLTF